MLITGPCTNQHCWSVLKNLGSQHVIHFEQLVLCARGGNQWLMDRIGPDRLRKLLGAFQDRPSSFSSSASDVGDDLRLRMESDPWARARGAQPAAVLHRGGVSSDRRSCGDAGAAARLDRRRSAVATGSVA